MVGTVVGATISGRVMTVMRHYKRLPVIGLLVASLVTALLAATAEKLSLVGIGIMLAVLSVGLGTLLPVSTVAIQNAVQPHELGTATGTANFFRSLGGALIVAAFGAIILGGTGLAGQALSFETLGRTAAESGVDLGGIFRLVFAAAALGFALALVFLWRMEERPLKGRAPEPVPAE